VLSQALMPHDQSSGFSKNEGALRDDFDWFLFCLGQFQPMIENGLFDFQEFDRHLLYVLDLLAGRYEDRIGAARAVRRYAKFYNFEDAITLVDEHAAMHGLDIGKLSCSRLSVSK
jgi:hypothetical protein